MNILASGNLYAFFDRWKCTPEERNLIVLYLAVIRLKSQLDSLFRFVESQSVTDGEGI